MSKPVKYKTIKWFNKTERKIFFGIDVLIDGEWCHVKDDKPLFYDDRRDAINKVKQLNKELKLNHQ